MCLFSSLLCIICEMPEKLLFLKLRQSYGDIWVYVFSNERIKWQKRVKVLMN